MHPDENIFFRLAKANQSAGRFWKKQLQPLKLTAVQGLVLVFLQTEDGLTSSELGKRVRLDSATLTGVLARLEKSGLAERRQDRQDRRAVRVHLTADGRRTGRQVAMLVARSHAAFLSSLPPEEVHHLLDLLQKIGE
jgi:DNA-binding MarR family transcriptional regulator